MPISHRGSCEHASRMLLHCMHRGPCDFGLKIHLEYSSLNTAAFFNKWHHWRQWLGHSTYLGLIKDKYMRSIYLLNSKWTNRASQRMSPVVRPTNASSDVVCWKERGCVSVVFETKLQVPWCVQCSSVWLACPLEPLQLVGIVLWLGPGGVAEPLQAFKKKKKF